MKWTWKLGRFAGIDTYVHASFALLVGWAAWASWSGAGSGWSMVLGITFLLAVFGSVLLHELGHALAARRYGIRTHRIVLSPIGGIAQLEGIPRQPRHELVVAIAGPAVNIGLALGLWFMSPLVMAWPVFSVLVGRLIVANLTLGVFNMLPVFPMDGGRVLRALLASRIGSLKATELAATIGQVLAVGIGSVALFVWGNVILTLIAGFVWIAARAELRNVRRAAFVNRIELLRTVRPYGRRI